MRVALSGGTVAGTDSRAPRGQRQPNSQRIGQGTSLRQMYKRSLRGLIGR
jgi:hypothetical protein